MMQSKPPRTFVILSILLSVCAYLLPMYSVANGQGMFSSQTDTDSSSVNSSLLVQGTAPYRGPRPSGVSPIKSSNNPVSNPPTIAVQAPTSGAVTPTAGPGNRDPQMPLPYEGPDGDANQLNSFSVNDNAKNYRAGDEVTLGASEVLNKDFFAAGERITIAGTVNGDVYAVGSDITFTGTVNGDLLLAGANVIINGTVNGDVRVVAAEVTLNTQVNGGLAMVGGTLTVSEGAGVAKNIALGCGTVEMNGNVNGSMSGFIGSLTLAGLVQGDVDIASNDIALLGSSDNPNTEPTVIIETGEVDSAAQAQQSNPVIGGDITYYSEQKVTFDESLVGGMVKHRVFPAVTEKKESTADKAGFGMFNIFGMLTALLMGLLLLKLAPNFMNMTAQTIRTRWLRSLLIGTALIIVLPLIAIVTMITLIGLPIGVLIFVMYFMGLYFTQFFVMYLIGQLVAEKLQNPLPLWGTYIIGLLVYHLILIVPVVGGLFGLLSVLTGFGALLLTKKDVWRSLRSQNLI